MKLFLLHIVCISVVGFLGINNAFGANTYIWIGGDSASPTKWEDANNWTLNGNAGVSYPGAVLGLGFGTDIVQFAVTSSGGYSYQPTLSTTITVASVEMGGAVSISTSTNQNPGVIITVNGTLNVTGDITGDPDATNNKGNYNYLQGTGTINCADINVGSGTATTYTGSNGRSQLLNNNYLLCDVTTLNVSKNVVITANADVINGNGFRLESGTMTLNGVITVNSNNLTNTTNIAYFTINTVTQAKNASGNQVPTTPLLILTNANAITPITAANSKYGSVNFYGDTGGTSTVKYTAANATVYTTAETSFGSGDGSGGINLAKPSYDYLVINGSGTAQIGVASAAGQLNTAADFTTQTPVTFNPTGSQPTTTTIGGNWINSTTVTGGPGATTVDGNLTSSTAGVMNMSTGSLEVKTNATNAGTITASSGSITIDGDLSNSGTLTMGSGSLNMAGNYTNTSVFTASTGPANFTSTDAQTLTDNSSSTLGTIFNTVNFSGGGTKTMTTSGTGFFGVSGIGVLTMSASNLLQTGGILTLYSTITSTATVAAIPSTASITGNVNVQRYFLGGSAATTRNYVSISPTVNDGTGSGTTPGNFSLAYLSASKGLFTAGPGANATSGFTVQNATPTVYLYRENVTVSNASFNGGNFNGLTNIKTSPYTYYSNAAGTSGGSTTIPVGNSIFLYYCGDNINNISSHVTQNKQYRVGGTYVDPEASIATQVGVLNQQNVTVKMWYTGSTTFSYTKTGFQLVGNPYASSIDWDLLYTTNAAVSGTNLVNTISIFNFRSKNYGYYQAGNSTGVGTNSVTHVIASGQGFYVQVATGSTTGALTFIESCKTNLQPNNIGGTNANPAYLLMGLPVTTTPTQILRVRVAKDSVDTDDIMLLFESKAKNQFDANLDIKRLPGFGNISTLASYSTDSVGTMLSINHMHSIDSTTRVKLYVNVSGSGSATDTLSGSGFASLDPRYDVYLVDHNKKDSLEFSKYPTYLFNINNSDTTTFGANRFEIVFHKKSGLQYKLLSFTGQAVSSGVQLTWRTLNEQNLTGFQVQRQDGTIQFISLSSLQSDGKGTYTYVDKSPLQGTNYYRLLQDDAFDNITYSGTISVNYSGSNNITKSLTLYPNPATTQFNVKINTDVPASVLVKVTNALGQIMISKVMDGDNIQQAVNSLLPGSYIVQITDEASKKVIGVTQFIKQ